MGTGSKAGTPDNKQPEVADQQESGSLDQMTPITSEDHIKGNPNAPVKIVEYSDMECPFCKRFHDTMNQVIDEYICGCSTAAIYVPGDG